MLNIRGLVQLNELTCFRINCCFKIGSTVSWLRQLVTSLMLQTGYIPRPVSVVLGQGFVKRM